MSEANSHELAMQFRDWILTRDDPRYDLWDTDDPSHSIMLTTPYGQAIIAFHHYDLDIIEFTIQAANTDEVKFYLHFEMCDLDHAEELFEEMVQSLLHLEETHTLQVLLCCTSGLTTSYFANNLQKTAEALNLDMVFHATPYEKLMELGPDYDIILMAPQIGYQLKNITMALKDKKVIQIPVSIFAVYDCVGIIELIRNTIREETEAQIPSQLPSIKVFTNKKKLAVLVVICENKQKRIIYRLVDHGRILKETNIIKAKYSLQDLIDLLDVELRREPDIDSVCISTPGVIDQGKLTFREPGIYNVDVIKLFTKRYDKPFYFYNDANTMAMGYYSLQESYETLSFYFHPRSTRTSGVGNVVKGKLHAGRNHIAGEMQYLANALKFKYPAKEIIKTQEGFLNLVSQYLIAIISVLDPEAIVICCDMFSDTNALHKELANVFQEEFIPDLILVNDPTEYMFLGCIYLALEEMQKQEEDKK